MRSWPPVASRSPRGLMAVARSSPSWPWKVQRAVPVATSQTRITPSMSAVASEVPSGVKASP